MTKRQHVMMERLRSILVCGQRLTPEISAIPRVAEAMETLARVVDQIMSTAVLQMNIENGLAGRRAGARQRLAAQLSLIARAARLLDRTRPGQFDELRVPRPRTEPRLLAAGALFMEQCAPHADAFIGYGLPATFIDDLQASVDDLRGVMREGAGHRLMSAAAQVNIPMTLAEGMAAVRTIDLAISIHCRNDGAFLGAWAHARGWSTPPPRSSVPLFPDRTGEWLDRAVATEEHHEAARR